MQEPQRHEFFGAGRIAIVSDTHGVLAEGMLEALAGADLIVHAGDVGSAAVIRGLSALAPTVAVRGNNDTEAKWPRGDHVLLKGLPEVVEIALVHGSLVVVHGHQWPRVVTRHARLRAAFAGARCIAYGHSHRLVIDDGDAPWVVNPGAAGRSRTFGGPSWLGLVATREGWRIGGSTFC